MRNKTTFIFVLIITLAGTLKSQVKNYPIFVSPSLNPPYSLKLSDYSKFGSQSLMVSITLNDLSISNVPVKLRITLKTAGITIENPVTLNTTPIYLDGGATSILFGEDLKDYFNINNLIFKGYGKEAYQRTGQLPEGFYEFSVEVLHFQTNKLISNRGSVTAWFALGKPPLLKLPLNETDMGEFKGVPIVFSWLPSNVGSPISANTVQYKFEMWEMRIDGISPYTVAATTPVFHEAQVFNTQYSFFPSSVMMEPGMRYAWRVTASDISGFVPFEQDGKSEMRTFTFKSKCEPVDSLDAEYRGGAGTFKWLPKENHTSYNIEVREQSSGWFSKSETYDNKAVFYELEPAKTYELRLQAVCNGDPQSVSDYSGWKGLAIPERKPILDTETCPECVCEDNTNTGELSNMELRQSLNPGDTLVNRFGKTRFIVKTVEPQGNGRYKGIFLYWAEIWNLKFVCEYWDLRVNTDNVIVDMGFESVYNPQFLLDVDAATDYLNNLGNAITNLGNDARIKDTVSVPGDILTIYITEGDSVMALIEDENGDQNTVVISTNPDDLEQVLIADKEGGGFVVNKQGDLMGKDEYVGTGGKEGKLDGYNKDKEDNSLSETTEITFSPFAMQKFGFDAYSDKKVSIQQGYPALKNGYRPAWKSVSSFATDIVIVGPTLPNTHFKDEMGIPAIVRDNELEIRGGYDGSEKALYAYQTINDSTEKIVGKLNVVSYSEEIKKVYLVAVNDIVLPDAGALEEKLNTIYKQAVVKWDVEPIENPIRVGFENENMVHGGSGILSPYNADQKEIVRAYTEDGKNNLEPGAYYLFFIEGVTGKTGDIAGYMPFQRQVGFIYDKPNLGLVAHELGHGAFNLKHTFSKDELIAAERTTNNLMDYNQGTELWKNQWDLIHNPQGMIFAFMQDEEEGASGRVFINQLVKWIKENKDKPTPFHTAKFSDGEALVEVDLTYYPEEGNSIIVHADLFPKYNSENAIDLSNEGKYTSVAPYKRVHTAFYLTFYYEDHSEEMKEAIKIWTYSYGDFLVLLSDLGYTITETDKKDIIESYKFALNESGYDCNKLDAIFEMMPDFVIDQLGDNALWKSLYSLLNNCNASRWGTDEYKAIANILNNISESFLHEKIEQNKLLFKEMLSDVPEAFIGDYVYALCKVGATVWSDSELSGAGYTLLYPSESIDITEYSNFNLEGDPTYQIGAIKEQEDEKEVDYTIGRMYVTIDKINKLMVNYKIVGMEDYSLFAPVKVHIDNQASMYMPAFVVYEIIDRNPYDPVKDLVNTAAMVLLPEIKFVRLKSLTRLFKGRGTNTGGNLATSGDELVKAFDFKIVDATESQLAALDHAFKRHGAELSELIGKPIRWAKKSELQPMLDNFNEAVSLIIKEGKLTGKANVPYGVKGSGISSVPTDVDVHIYKHVVNGKEYYLYLRSTDKQFVSGGLRTREINYTIKYE